MSIPDFWSVSGVVFKVDGFTPFTTSDGLKVEAYDFCNNTETSLGWQPGLDANGNFSIGFNKWQFKDIIPGQERPAPNIYFRVYDDLHRVIYQSHAGFVPPSASSAVDITVERMPVPTDWHVRGMAYELDETTPYVNGNLAIYRVRAGQSPHRLALTGLSNFVNVPDLGPGYFQLTFVRGDFQHGNNEISAPGEVFFRIYDLQNSQQVIWESNVIIISDSESTVRLVVPEHAVLLEEEGVDEEVDEEVDEPDIPIPQRLSVFGTIFDVALHPLEGVTVKAYDAFAPDVPFREEACTSADGYYHIEYDGNDFPGRPAPDLFIKVYSTDGAELACSDVVEHAFQHTEINVTLSSELESEYCVFGHITNKSRQPVIHHSVEAYVLCITDGKFEERQLGVALTDINGYYEIKYEPDILKFPITEDPVDHGADTTSLFIKLPREQATAGAAVAYDTSHIVCHSAMRQRIDIRVDRLSSCDGSEYGTVLSALSAYLSAMEDNISREEPGFSNRMQYISCKTGIAEAKVVCFFYARHFHSRVIEELEVAKSPFVLNTGCDFEQFMYATFRAGYPNDVFALCAVNEKRYYRALMDAIVNRIISESSAAKLPAFWGQRLEVVRILTIAVEMTEVDIFARTVLEVNKGTNELPLDAVEELQIQQVVKIFQDVQGDMPAFWADMQKPGQNFTGLFIAQLEFIYDLYSISNDFIPFAQGAYSYFVQEKVEQYNSPIEAFRIRNLASVDEEEWRVMTEYLFEFADDEAVKQLAGDGNVEKLNILVMTTMRQFGELFARENIVEAYVNNDDPIFGTIGEFLRTNENFDLDTTNIDQYIVSYPTNIPATLNIDELRALQRVHRLTANPASQLYLLNNGFDSAYKISVVPEEIFTAEHGQALGDIEDAKQIHRLAVVYATEMLNLLGQFHTSLNFFEDDTLVSVCRGLPVGVCPTGLITPDQSSTLPADGSPVPTYETLFGALSQVHFKNTQSVFGASAYFVDLLEFISGFVNPRSLFARRPELEEIELTDGNAETILPYIDIVLGILENAISPLHFFLTDNDNKVKDFLAGAAEDVLEAVIPNNLKTALNYRAIELPSLLKIRQSETGANDYYLSTGSWRILFSRKPQDDGYLITAYPQTGKSSAELAVMPEHRNPLAFEALSRLYFPLQLPLDPGADEIQETMHLLGVSKHDSIVAFRRDVDSRYDDTADGRLVCANLGISGRIKNLLEWKQPGPGETSTLPHPWELWGLQQSGNRVPQAARPEELVPGSTWIEIMSFVPEFMRRTGLDVESMMDIFAMRAFSHISLCGSVKGLQTGNPNEFRIIGLCNNGNPGDLIDIYRMIRLRTVLQCSWKDLDCFLIAANGGVLSNCLRKIHVSQLFMDRYSVSFADIGCFWGAVVASVDERFGKSPFEERFISKRLNDAAVTKFKNLLGTDGNPSGNSTPGLGTVEDAKQALQQVLQLSQTDLDIIIKNEINSTTGSNLNLNTVSLILRVVILTKTLRLGIEDFYALKTLTGINPFDVDKPENLLYFDDEWKRLSERGLRPRVIKKFIDKPSFAEAVSLNAGNAEWVQKTVRSLRDMVTQTEEFLISDAAPDFGNFKTDGVEDWNTFKKNYRSEHTHNRVAEFLTKSFSEFTGGDSELANRLLDRRESATSSNGEKWLDLAKAGWSLSLNLNDSEIVDDFSLTEDFRKNSANTATWSAVFIAHVDGDISLRLNYDACDTDFKAVLMNGDEPVIEATSEVDSKVKTIVITDLTAGKAIRIDLSVSAFTADVNEYYINLQWNAATETDLRGEVDKFSWVNVPISSLIPAASWTGFADLESTLPVFRKMAEYLTLTGMNPGLFRMVMDKYLGYSVNRGNPEWAIPQPEDFLFESAAEPVYADIWKKFTRLLDIQILHRSFPVDESQLIIKEGQDLFWELINAVESENNDSADVALERLAGIQNRWDRTRLVDFVKATLPESGLQVWDMASPAMLMFLFRSMPVMEKIGVPINILRNVQMPEPVYSPDVINFRGALQQRLGIDSWNEMVTSMMNVMRVRRRDALVAFLTYPGPYLNQSSAAGGAYVNYLENVLYNAGVLTQSNEGQWSARIYNALSQYGRLHGVSVVGGDGVNHWEVTPDHWAVLDGRKGYCSSNDIYANFLIDTEMNTDMITSRIVQGSAAIQLFVQRALLGLEPLVHLGETERERWKWLKNYRLWEANRKVFLYPENWIEPELRDDKTPFFEELEAEFEDGEITTDSAKNAIGNYLSKMRTVAGLDIIGVYRGNSAIPRGLDTLHIIGKTKSLPLKYYYRCCHRKNNLPGVWTPWEGIEIDIQGNSVLPAMLNGQLHIFWAEFKPVNIPGPADKQENVSVSSTSGGSIALPVPNDTTVVDLSLCWTSLVNNKWMEKKQTISFIDVNNDFYIKQNPGINVADNYHFRVCEVTDEKLRIEVYKTYGEHTLEFNAEKFHAAVEDIWEPYELAIAAMDDLSDALAELKQPGNNESTVLFTHRQRAMTKLIEPRPQAKLARELNHLSLRLSHSIIPAIYQTLRRESREIIDNVSEVVINKRLRSAGTYTIWHNGKICFQKADDHDSITPALRDIESILPSVTPSDSRINIDIVKSIVPTFQNALQEFVRTTNTISTVRRDSISDPIDTTLIENYTTSTESGQAVTRFDNTKLLEQTNGSYNVIIANSGFLNLITLANPHAMRQFFFNEPCFLMDDFGTYLIQPSNIGAAGAYKMEMVSHPIVQELQKRFDESGLSGLMYRGTQALSMVMGNYSVYPPSGSPYQHYGQLLLGYHIAGDWQAWDAGQQAFGHRYLPYDTALSRPFPMDVVDFNYGTPNGIYNWELFFHAPLLIARQLSANQRYDEALDWFHMIFDPRNKLTGYEQAKLWVLQLSGGAQFWNFLPFFANKDATKTITEMLDSSNNSITVSTLDTLIDDWKDDPFNPHLIARNRIVAYQKAVVMQYLDTLVAWADQKFRIDTLESINEAIQLYILAAEILGKRPQSVPSALEASPISYTQMKRIGMRSFSNVMIRLENSLVRPINGARNTAQGAVAQPTGQILNLGPQMYYFTVPRNEKVMGYWDLLDDRLFKIRNGMNIDGVKRQLSLFAPPIDPAMLVRAAAAGIDIGAALSGMFAPVPKYRFTFMVQKAIEFCNIVQSMGGAVLSALEKKDAEEVARLRAEHESTLLRLSKEIRHMQIEEAGVAIKGLENTRETVEFRKRHYEDLIEAGISDKEQSQLDFMLAATISSATAQAIRAGAAIPAPIPDCTCGVSGYAASLVATVEHSPSRTTEIITNVVGSAFDLAASLSHNVASRSGIKAGYERRMQDWELQKSLADKELDGIEQQLIGAEIRKKIAEKELSNLEKQIAQAEETYQFLKSKYTNKELYQWMVSELSSLYNSNYRLAYDIAKSAEKSYEFELGITNRTSLIRFDCWDSLRRGLLAGERLMLDLRRMEKLYIENNNRELEITKPISIAQLNPQALLELQETGHCEFHLPEMLFDLDFPGHYFRRIRSVSLTIPCVSEPYVSISAKLTLHTNSMRTSDRANPANGNSYPRNDGGNIDDERFVDQRIGIQGIATGQPNEATGVFDFNFRDERYLPFEGAGVISSWRLELPAKVRQFNYRNISDVVLRISYTAREDGGLKRAAEKWIESCIDRHIENLRGSDEPLNRVFSLKHEFPTAWKSLQDKGSAKFSATPDHYPYFLSGKELVVVDTAKEFDSAGAFKPQLLVQTKNSGASEQEIKIEINGAPSAAIQNPGNKLYGVPGIYAWPIENWGGNNETAFFDCTIELEDASQVDDVFLSIHYAIAE